MNHTPQIIAFACHWCADAAADAAGRSRQSFPAGVRVVRVLCSGRIDPQHVLQAFAAGADGVILLGCPPGNCHYHHGNLQTLKRFHLLRPVLARLGIATDRLRLAWVSASQGDVLVRILHDMAQTLHSLGPIHP